MLDSPLDHLGVGPEEVELLEDFEDELLVGQLKEATKERKKERRLC